MAKDGPTRTAGVGIQMWSLGGCAHPPRLKEKCRFSPVRISCVIFDLTQLTEAAGALSSPGLVLDKLRMQPPMALTLKVFWGAGVMCVYSKALN